jgi:hypothetical protein
MHALALPAPPADAHFTYNYQDLVLMSSTATDGTVAHRDYAYNTYTGA